MDTRLATAGYLLGPSKYTPNLGYSSLNVVISGKPTQRFFDVKTLRMPTFDGRFFHETQITRHGMELLGNLKVCLGEIQLDTYRGDRLRAFSFGGVFNAKIEMDELYCELTSEAPIFKLQEDPGSVSGVIVDEIMDLLAEKEAHLAGHENELYSRLAKISPYPLFLACIISLQKRADNYPMHLRREKYHKLTSSLKRAIQIVCERDGWDGRSPSLEDLLADGGVP